MWGNSLWVKGELFKEDGGTSFPTYKIVANHDIKGIYGTM